VEEEGRLLDQGDLSPQPLAVRPPLYHRPGKADITPVGLQQQAEQLQQGALAGPVGTGQQIDPPGWKSSRLDAQGELVTPAVFQIAKASIGSMVLSLLQQVEEKVDDQGHRHQDQTEGQAEGEFPLLVSRAMAVVMVRVYPRMLPPSIIATPTSAMTRPKPATTAAITPKRTSSSSCQAARRAPRPGSGRCS
jgi:hypothetical protein